MNDIRRAGTDVAGFSMIEVLVTLLIISLALLGTAGLQAYAMRLNQSGQFRSQAVFLVADLVERMEANKVAAVAGNYVQPASSSAGALNEACSTGVCSSQALAVYDLSQWENRVVATLPQASWEVAQTVPGNPSTYTVRVGWVERQSDITYEGHEAATGVGAGAGGAGERFFYTATRTIYSDE